MFKKGRSYLLRTAFALLAVCDVMYAMEEDVAVLQPPHTDGMRHYSKKPATSPIYFEGYNDDQETLNPALLQGDDKLLTIKRTEQDKDWQIFSTKAHEPRAIDDYFGYPLKNQAQTFFLRATQGEKRSFHVRDLRQDEETRLPLNPLYPDAQKGRGFGWFWGPNRAGDGLISRYSDPDDQGLRHLEIAVVQRPATERYEEGVPLFAIPGGMVEDESVIDTVLREIREETGMDATALRPLLGEPIYQGYAGDPRATAHAWNETTAYHLHIPDNYEFEDELTAEQTYALAAIQYFSNLLEADDTTECPAGQKRWLRVTEESVDALFAGHAFIVRTALQGKPLSVKDKGEDDKSQYNSLFKQLKPAMQHRLLSQQIQSLNAEKLTLQKSANKRTFLGGVAGLGLGLIAGAGLSTLTGKTGESSLEPGEDMDSVLSDEEFLADLEKADAKVAAFFASLKTSKPEAFEVAIQLRNAKAKKAAKDVEALEQKLADLLKSDVKLLEKIQEFEASREELEELRRQRVSK